MSKLYIKNVDYFRNQSQKTYQLADNGDPKLIESIWYEKDCDCEYSDNIVWLKIYLQYWRIEAHAQKFEIRSSPYIS